MVNILEWIQSINFKNQRISTYQKILSCLYWKEDMPTWAIGQAFSSQGWGSFTPSGNIYWQGWPKQQCQRWVYFFKKRGKKTLHTEIWGHLIYLHRLFTLETKVKFGDARNGCNGYIFYILSLGKQLTETLKSHTLFLRRAQCSPSFATFSSPPHPLTAKHKGFACLELFWAEGKLFRRGM